MRVLLLLFIFPLLGSEVSFSVDAKVMEYDSTLSELSGQDVTITFKDGSKLMGRKATLHFDKKVGEMKSESVEDPVVFSGIISKEGEASRHVVVKADEMGVELLPTDGEKELLFVTALGSVQIFVDNEYVAYGSRATFQNHTQQGSIPNTGIVTLEGKKSRVEKLNGDVVLAEKIEFNPFENKLLGWEVDAELGPLKLAAREMAWDPKRGEISFSENVAISHPVAGKLTCQGTLEIVQGDAPYGLAKITATGPLCAEQVEKSVKLVSFGEVVVDQIERTIVIKSPEDEGFSMQAYIDDRMGRVYADRFDIAYDLIGEEVVPERIDIDGRVRMLNRYIPDEKLQKKVEQYAVAEHIHYLPRTGEMELKGKKGKRVLLFDKVQGLELSAPKFAVVRGPNQEPEFHGKGNVRLKFTPEDAAILKEYFPTLPF